MYTTAFIDVGQEPWILSLPVGRIYCTGTPQDYAAVAEGFWSITMYNAGYFFVPNPINRYSISPRQDLKANSDGSVDIYIQKESPGAIKKLIGCPRRRGNSF